MPYTVYVIRLKPEVLQESSFRNENPNYKEAKACLYVGQTWHTPEHRYTAVVAGCRGVSPALEQGFDECTEEGRCFLATAGAETDLAGEAET
jgi:hypothetical protein